MIASGLNEAVTSFFESLPSEMLPADVKERFTQMYVYFPEVALCESAHVTGLDFHYC
jgi:hypothetical protein